MQTFFSAKNGALPPGTQAAEHTELNICKIRNKIAIFCNGQIMLDQFTTLQFLSPIAAHAKKALRARSEAFLSR